MWEWRYHMANLTATLSAGGDDARHLSPCTRPAPISNWPVWTVLAAQPWAGSVVSLRRNLRVAWGVTLQDRELLHFHTVSGLIQSSFSHRSLKSIPRWTGTWAGEFTAEGQRNALTTWPRQLTTWQSGQFRALYLYMLDPYQVSFTCTFFRVWVTLKQRET